MDNILKYFLLSTLAIFAPIKMIIITVGVLIFADLLLGILAARKRNEKQFRLGNVPKKIINLTGTSVPT